MLRGYRAALGLLASLWFASPAAADQPPVWVVSGKTSTVYLFGSMHLLPAGEFRFSPELAQAYADAEHLLFEVVVRDLDPAMVAATTAARAMDPAGRSLAEQLGPDADRVLQAADQAGVDLSRFNRLEPWFVGLAITAMALEQRGYSQANGVEQLLQERAAGDRKPMAGLETLDQQLALLDGLPAPRQAELLLKSMQDASQTDQELAEMLRAWREGDDAALRQQLALEFDHQPDLAEPMVYSRNRRWAAQIAELLAGSEDTLVVVGALHLVGEQGLPQLLREAGYRVERRAGTGH